MRPCLVSHWCRRRGLLLLVAGSIFITLLLSIFSIRALPSFSTSRHTSAQPVPKTEYWSPSLTQHVTQEQTSGRHFPLMQEHKALFYDYGVSEGNKDSVPQLSVVVSSTLDHVRYYEEKKTVTTSVEANEDVFLRSSLSDDALKEHLIPVVKSEDTIEKVSKTFHNSRHFIKEHTDLFSTEGDESDYLFGACESSAKVKPNYLYGFVGPFRYLANYKNPCWMEPGEEDVPTVYCIPYFYLVGAPKAGSSDVYNRITMHPDVVTPEMKETRWFDRARFSGKPHFSSFLSNFYNASKLIHRSMDLGTNYHRRIIGDGSPSYFFDNRRWRRVPGNEGCSEPRVVVASHIHHLYNKARIIFILRNPVHRLYSSYLYNHAKKEVVSSRSFDEYVREAIQLYNDCFARYSLRQCVNNAPLFHQAKVMLVVGMYSVFIHDWLQLFPREQLFIMSTEEYTKNMADCLGKVFSFLHLRALNSTEMEEIIQPGILNRGYHYSTAGPMLNTTKTLLEEFYRPYNQQLASLLGDTQFLWMN